MLKPCPGLLLLAFFLNSCYALQRPNLADYETYFYKPTSAVAQRSAPGSASEQLQVTFLGTTTLYLNDGETGILIDGFFTRPGNLWEIALGKIQSDKAKIRDYLQRLGIEKLAAIPVYHAHHDHAMDSAEIARLTGATLLGSESVGFIAQGAGLPPEQYRVVTEGEPHTFGKFKLTLVRGQHVHLPSVLELTGMRGKITAPLTQPVSFFDYREGETYTIIIEHPLGTSMLHSGALAPGVLNGYKVDTVFLCTPGLPKLSATEREQFYQEVVLETGASKIIPVHWDDFFLSLDEPLLPLPRFAEDLDAAMQFLIQKQAQHPEIQIEFLPVWQAVPLFQAP